MIKKKLNGKKVNKVQTQNKEKNSNDINANTNTTKSQFVLTKVSKKDLKKILQIVLFVKVQEA